MLAGTDGLPPWLDVNRFHVSRRSFAPYPTAMVQGSVSTPLVQEDNQDGTTSPTSHVAVAAPILLPLGVRGNDRKNPRDIRGELGISSFPKVVHTSYPGLYQLTFSDYTYRSTQMRWFLQVGAFSRA